MKITMLVLWRLLGCLSVCGQPVAAGDIVINEILFNPSRDGYDYVELLNLTARNIPLRGLKLANRNGAGDIGTVRALQGPPEMISPQGLIVVTPNKKWVIENYLVVDTSTVNEVSSLPGYPDDEGAVVLLAGDTIIDEVRYSEKWHFSLLRERDGVALERIAPGGSSNDEHNWSSASSTVGFGTPGRQNSQRGQEVSQGDAVAVGPAVFTPDNDGVDDRGIVSINVSEPGYVANAIIFDIAGRRVKYLLKNRLLGVSNIFRWDGDDEKLEPVPGGIYIVFVELFNLQGKTRRFRHTIVVSRGGR